MQYLLLIYQNEAEFGKIDAAARQKVSAACGLAVEILERR